MSQTTRWLPVLLGLGLGLAALSPGQDLPPGRLVERLGSPHVEDRIAASRSLREYGSIGREALLEVLGVEEEEPPPVDEATAARIRELVGRLGDEAYRVREDSAEALRRIGPVVRPFLSAAASDGDPETRQRASDLLAEFGTLAAAGTDWTLVREALATLVIFADPADESIFRRYLSSPDDRLARLADVGLRTVTTAWPEAFEGRIEIRGAALADRWQAALAGAEKPGPEDVVPGQIPAGVAARGASELTLSATIVQRLPDGRSMTQPMDLTIVAAFSERVDRTGAGPEIVRRLDSMRQRLAIDAGPPLDTAIPGCPDEVRIGLDQDVIGAMDFVPADRGLNLLGVLPGGPYPAGERRVLGSEEAPWTPLLNNFPFFRGLGEPERTVLESAAGATGLGRRRLRILAVWAVRFSNERVDALQRTWFVSDVLLDDRGLPATVRTTGAMFQDLAIGGGHMESEMRFDGDCTMTYEDR